VISIGNLEFSFGVVSVIGAIVLPSIYIFCRLCRHGDAWLHRRQQPQERVIAMIVLTAIFGFIGGSGVQPWVDKFTLCRQQGYDACVGRVLFAPFYEQQRPPPASVTPIPRPQTGGANKHR
jgi:hypothetical protein